MPDSPTTYYPRNTRVEVHWTDSSIVDRYEQDRDAILEPLVLTSVGMVIHHNAQSIAIARDTHSDGVWRGITVIPSFAIQSVTALRKR